MTEQPDSLKSHYNQLTCCIAYAQECSAILPAEAERYKRSLAEIERRINGLVDAAEQVYKTADSSTLANLDASINDMLTGNYNCR